jgi:hypothetical protein
MGAFIRTRLRTCVAEAKHPRMDSGVDVLNDHPVEEAEVGQTAPVRQGHNRVRHDLILERCVCHIDVGSDGCRQGCVARAHSVDIRREQFHSVARAACVEVPVIEPPCRVRAVGEKRRRCIAAKQRVKLASSEKVRAKIEGYGGLCA